MHGGKRAPVDMCDLFAHILHKITRYHRSVGVKLNDTNKKYSLYFVGGERFKISHMETLSALLDLWEGTPSAVNVTQ